MHSLMNHQDYANSVTTAVIEVAYVLVQTTVNVMISNVRHALIIQKNLIADLVDY